MCVCVCVCVCVSDQSRISLLAPPPFISETSNRHWDVLLMCCQRVANVLPPLFISELVANVTNMLRAFPFNGLFCFCTSSSSPHLLPMLLSREPSGRWWTYRHHKFKFLCSLGDFSATTGNFDVRFSVLWKHWVWCSYYLYDVRSNQIAVVAEKIGVVFLPSDLRDLFCFQCVTRESITLPSRTR
jgi:hypothetical protein